ncbi:MAG: hypothetical protein P4L35_12505 [Ignavibacteriaceae bacterium]|nr:hypothetical protein [Ignavibacteriaceae bacterium]
MKLTASIILLIIAVIFPQSSLVNTAHLDHLYQEIKVNNNSLGIIHIYAEAPDYKWEDASGEGIACVDDAARAAVFYMNYYKQTHDRNCLPKIKSIVNFLFYMHSGNGFFYNFIWQDNTIDTTYKTSLAEPNWWSWRALWALAEARNFYLSTNPRLSGEIKEHIDITIDALEKWLPKGNNTVVYHGYELPAWLPFESASDQAAIIIKALSAYYRNNKSENIKSIIEHLCTGIMKMQQGDESTPPYYAFLSWQNSWHAWGNSQADALIDAGRVLNNHAYIDAAVKEIKHFYPWLIEKGFFNEFHVVINEKNITSFSDTIKFAQIAYGIRPIIYSCMNAYEMLKDTFYLNTALSAAKWFFKNNPANSIMYDPQTGRGYDGIIAYGKINNNSGAESTIESLFSILRLEKDKTAKKMLLNLYNKM